MEPKSSQKTGQWNAQIILPFLAFSLIIVLLTSLIGLFAPILVPVIGGIYLGVSAASFRVVQPDQIGCILRFGAPIAQVGPGLFFVPRYAYSLDTETRLAIEEQFPEEDYKKTPIRITHGAANQPTGDPLDTRLTTSVSIVARYKIVDFPTFLQEIGNRNELKRQIRDAIVNTAAIECAKFSLAINLQRREELNYLLAKAVKELTATWGIEIVNVQFLEIDLGNEIEKAQTNVSVSAINIATNRNNSQKIIFEGAAEAEVHRMFQYAKAEGIKEVARILAVDDKTALYQIETLANVWRKSKADLNLYGTDVQQLFNMLMTVYKSSSEPPNQIPS